jgi:hypothetical protein
MKKKKLILLLLFASLCGLPMFAQSVGPISITSSQCASIAVGSGNATVGIVVTGTWTGTLQPEVSVQGQAPANAQVTPSSSSTPTSTITGDGTYTASVAGMSTFSLCGNTVASGTAVVFLNVSTASAGKGGGGGASGGTLVNSIAALNTAQTAPTGTVRTQCPSAINPFAWIQASDSSWYQQLGIDTTSTSIFSPNGVLTHCRLEYFNDTATTPQLGANQDDLLYVWHQLNPADAANTPGYGMYIHSQLSNSATGNLGRVGGAYLEEFLEGNPSELATSSDTGAFGIRAQVTDQRTSNTGCASTGLCGPAVGGSFTYFGNPTVLAIKGYGVQANALAGAGNGGNTEISAVDAQLGGGTVGSSNYVSYDFHAENTFSSGTLLNSFSFLAGVRIDDFSSPFGANSPPADTYAEYIQGGPLFINGSSTTPANTALWVPAINATRGPIAVNGSFSLLGGLATSQYSAPATGNITVVNGGTTGSTSYSYVIVARDAAGGVVSSSAQTTATGNATLDNTNFNEIRLKGAAVQNGAVSFFDIYRTASGGTPSSTGKIGTINPTIGAIGNLSASTAFAFDDKGLAGDSSSAPSGNSTGAIAPFALMQPAARTYAGTCAMSAATTCTFSITPTYKTPICIATQQATGTVIAAECSVSGTTVTVTAASSNSNTWAALVMGNPN